MPMPQPLYIDMEGYKVLVVEDNQNDRVLYKRLLSRSSTPFEVFEAENAKDGLAISAEKAIDCIVLDYRLPDADGIEFIKSYREQAHESEVAIVMVTGQGSEETAVEAMKLGALDYIAKSNVIDGFFVQNILNAIERSHLKRQVRQYQDELEKSYVALSDFTHTVSHDLKAPLRRIVQYCDILKDEIGDSLTPENANYINRLMVSAKRMQKLVDDLLNYARTMNAHEDRVDLDFDKLVHEVVDEAKTHLDDNNATVIIQDLPVLPGYPTRIKELFQNLIENALKYRSDASPLIKISAEDHKAHCVFSVQDNGKGIEEKYHEQIFNEFERLFSQDEIEGTGLGLSICQKVVQAHGGKIWVESKPGEGATFKFTISKL